MAKLFNSFTAKSETIRSLDVKSKRDSRLYQQVGSQALGSTGSIRLPVGRPIWSATLTSAPRSSSNCHTVPGLLRHILPTIAAPSPSFTRNRFACSSFAMPIRDGKNMFSSLEVSLVYEIVTICYISPPQIKRNVYSLRTIHFLLCWGRMKLQELVRAKDWGRVVLFFAFWTSRTGRKVWGLLGAEGALLVGESTMEVEGGSLVGRMDGWV